MSTFLKQIHHVQLAAPIGSEDEARAFYTKVLGFTEVEKPAEMKKNGGCWFEQGDISLHIGIETPFVPAEKLILRFTLRTLKPSSCTSKRLA